MEFMSVKSVATALPVHTSEGQQGLHLDSVSYDAEKTVPWERKFNPYDFNGGYVSI